MLFRSDILGQLGQILAQQGKPDEAENLIRELLATAKRVRGEADPVVAERLNNLARWQQDHGKVEEAEVMMLEALAMRKKLLGEDHVDVTDSLSCLGQLYGNQGNYAEAEKLFRQAVAIEKKRPGSQPRRIINLISDLLLVLKRQENYAATEPVMLEGNDLVQQSPETSSDEKRAWLEKLRSFYIDWAVAAPGTGKMAKAAEWGEKLAAFDELSLQSKPDTKSK